MARYLHHPAANDDEVDAGHRISLVPPLGLAKFDSASAMLMALARFHDGRDFPALGQGELLRSLVQLADLVPRRVRERVFAHLGAREGVAPGDVGRVDTDQIARWAVAQYPQRRYPGVMIGSSNGALMHLGAASALPWLPQTVLTLVRQRHVHPDDARGALEAGAAAAERFLAANEDVQLHHMHDPAQDRLMLGLITYFRWKYRRLPAAYRTFLQHNLAPGGTILLVECNRSSKVTRVGDRYVYQFGAVGGPTAEEYLRGGSRVARYLAAQGSPVRRWCPPAVDDHAPEAEWGFEPALRDDVVAFARKHGYRVRRLCFEDPEDPSPQVAELYRRWNQERGLPVDRLVIESFILMEPYWVLRTGSVPFWMTFNMEHSLDAVNRYLSASSGYDHLHLMLFAHGVDSIGLPPIEDWQRLLARARRKASFLGVNPRAYPAHFAAFARYSSAVRTLSGHHEIPPPLPLDRLAELAPELEIQDVFP